MAGLSERQLKAISENRIDNALDDFRARFKSTYPTINVHGPLVNFERLTANPVGRDLALRLIGILLNFPAASALPSENGQYALNGDIGFLFGQLSSNQAEFIHVAGLLQVAVTQCDDKILWSAVYSTIALTKQIRHPTTPPQSSQPSFKQTPWAYTTSNLADTSELREDVDPILQKELDSHLLIGHPEFFNKFFGGVRQLSEIAGAVFESCKGVEVPLFNESTGWVEWPEDCDQSRVLHWLQERISEFLQFANKLGFQPPTCRRYLAAPNQPIPGPSNRKLDIGVIYNRGNKSLRQEVTPENTIDSLPTGWFDVLVPGELKSNLRADNHTNTWLDLSKYAREILAAEDARSSVLGFTLCGPIMRLWHFDRLGAIASEPFNIHSNGLMFVTVVLGFLWMTEQELGFDHSIYEDNSGRYIEITMDSQPQRLYLNQVVTRKRCIVGRSTTCWKAYLNGDQSTSPFIVKDSWQYEERPDEGLLLKKVTEAGIKNVAEYYYHETVHNDGTIDDIWGSVRKGLDVNAGNYPFRNATRNSKLADLPNADVPVMKSSASGSRGRSRSTKRQRSPSLCRSSIPHAKRPCSESPVKQDRTWLRENRVHRRLVLRRVGKAIHHASLPAVILTGIIGGIKGHESLLQNQVLHRDISIGNIMLEENESDGFLIDLDLGIEIDRKEASGAPSKTGTKIFMAIGALYGENHTFMHDLESFFWVLFWLCIHCPGPGQRRITDFEDWNYATTDNLAMLKAGMVVEEYTFNKQIAENVTDYCRPLMDCLQKLRVVVFPDGKRHLNEDRELYSRMRLVLETSRDSI